MKTMGTSILFLCLASVSFGANWSGKLIDASCHGRQDKKLNAPCDITQNTALFALQTTDGKVYKLDASGNAKAASEIRQGSKNAERVTVVGTEEGQMIKVDAINFDSVPGKR